jgi:O-acetylhomoserine/O-acetylserine sulfhydrylase-like pyridoxal-dependent enzyme
VSLAKFGIETSFVDATRPEAFAAAMRPNTRAVFAESLGNPSLVVLDIAAVADVAHAHGVPLVIDNTVPSPYLCNPLALGADIVVHSATKYLAGHGTTLGGVVVESGRFPWDNGKFPGMTEPSPGYHGVKFYETFGDFGFTMRAAWKPCASTAPRCPDERLADPAGRGDPAAAHGRATAQRAGGGTPPAAASAGGLGQLPRPARPPAACAAAAPDAPLA